MSAKIMGHVWELDLPANKQLVLLAMADHADHEGENIYPSLGLIAWKTGYSESQTRRIIKALVTDGILVEVAAPDGKPKVYRVVLSAGKRKGDYKKTPSTAMTPLQDDTPSTAMTGVGLHSYDTPTPSTAMTPKPSIKPSSKPKEPRARNEWYEVVQAVWGHTGGRNADMEKMLRGVATKKPYSDYNLDTPVTDPQLLLRWKAWYLKTKNTRPDAILPSRPETVQSSVGEYQAYLAKRVAAQIIPLTTEKIEPMPADKDAWLAEFAAGMEKSS